jgi:CDP-diacylglycerol--glycerol-3-phosphate 3-phosphatidyltransferase
MDLRENSLLAQFTQLPNLLSLLRLLLIPFIAFFIVRGSEKTYPYLIFLFFFSVLLDFFDGFLARKLSQITRLGKIMDPLADKLLGLTVMISLVVRSDFPLWLALVAGGRDFMILAFSLVLLRRLGEPKSSIPVGKVAFGLLSLLLMIHLIALHPGVTLLPIKRFMAVLCFVFFVWSFLEYLFVFLREKKNG